MIKKYNYGFLITFLFLILNLINIISCNLNKTTKVESSHELPQDITSSTTAPAAVVIINPKFNPITTSETSITLSGKCNSDTLVSLQGDSQQLAKCENSMFSFDIEEITEGTFNFQIFQKDSFGNVSTGTSFVWVQSLTLPPPVLTNPSMSPYYSTTKILNVRGTCLPGKKISITGSATQSTVCNLNSEFSMGISTLIDATLNLNLVQKDLDTGVESAPQALQWISDSIAPLTPVLTTPSSNPLTSNDTELTIEVVCENGASVAISGSYTETKTCVSNSATFIDNTQTTDNTYNYTIIQTDQAGNASGNLSVSWTKTSP